MIITIDGSVATGKSTIAKKVADALGYIFFDTGAMYRCATYGIIKQNIPLDDPEKLQEFLDKFEFDMKIRRGDKCYYVSEENVTNVIRGDEVTSKVSEIAAIPQVREKLVSIQRELAKGVNAVFEGRDMGTVVFPDADLKIFLTGRPEVRAERRMKELKEKFPETSDKLTLEKILEQINRRDHYDSTRKVSPLKQAEDAHIIDTSDLTPDEVVYKALECKDRQKRQI